MIDNFFKGTCMREKVIIFLRQMEMTGVYLLIFFLPFLKVPKNIGIVLFIIGAIGWRIADKSIKLRRPDTFECILLTIFFIALGRMIDGKSISFNEFLMLVSNKGSNPGSTVIILNSQ